MPADRLLRLQMALDEATEAVAAHAAPVSAFALGWATVELDRAASELASELGRTVGSFVVAPDSVALGARCRVAHVALGDGLALAILEAATEGRLAATLARLGEGPAAVWFAAGPDAAWVDAAPARPGPFGPERILPGGPVHGPHRFLIATEAGTIRA